MKSDIRFPDQSQAYYVNIAEMLATFSRVYYRWLWSQMKSVGSGPGWQQILSILQHSGPMIMSALSAEMSESPRVITDAVDSLEELNLLKRVPHPSDRRAKILEITSDGEQFLEVSRAASAKALAGLLADYSEPEQDDLVKVFALALTTLRAKGADEGRPTTSELAASMNPKRFRDVEAHPPVIRDL